MEKNGKMSYNTRMDVYSKRGNFWLFRNYNEIKGAVKWQKYLTTS